MYAFALDTDTHAGLPEPGAPAERSNPIEHRDWTDSRLRVRTSNMLDLPESDTQMYYECKSTK